MELIRGLHNFRDHHLGCVATIGAFDGIHLGHQAVLKQLMTQGEKMGLPTAVIIFEPLPREYFSPNNAPARLMSFKEKFIALRDLGIDRVLRVHFDARFRDMGAREFIHKIFVAGLGAKFIVVGDDLRFGRDRSGDFNLLKQVGLDYGFEVVDTNTLKFEDERVSSTRIRQALADADFEAAERMLGRPYSISGRVIVGQQLGRTIGSPTANVELHRLRSPMQGVYAVEVEGVADTLWPAVANVGVRPTIGDLTKAILEVHLIGFKQNIYRKNIKVIFRKHLRNEIKFNGLDELKAQIAKDVEHASQYFELEK